MHPILEVAAAHEPAMWGAAFMPLQLSMAPALTTLKRRKRRVPVHGPNVHPMLEIAAFHESERRSPIRLVGMFMGREQVEKDHGTFHETK